MKEKQTKKQTPFTQEELNFIISEMKYIFANNYFNGDFEEFTEYTENDRKSFDKQVALLKSIIGKLKKEKKI